MEAAYMPTWKPDDWGSYPPHKPWTVGEKLFVLAFNVGLLVLILTVYILETTY